MKPDTLKGDSFAQAVEAPWQSTPSIYGPVATAEQQAVVWLAGGRLRLAVGLLDLVNGLAFALAGMLLIGVAEDPGRARWAALTFALNPLLLLVVVAGGHLDALVAAVVVAALLGPPENGLMAGLAVAIKLTAGLPVAAWTWLLRRRPRALAMYLGLVAIGAGTFYLQYGFHAFNQARKAASMVSVGTPWRLVRAAAQAVAGHGPASTLVSVGSLLVMAGLACALARHLPRHPRLESGPESSRDIAEIARVGLVLALAWALAAPYVLAWYDTVPWALLALLPWSKYHRILLAHTAMLALAYLPGRVVALPAGLAGITTALRSGVSPVVLALLIVAAFSGRDRLLGRVG